MKVQKHKGKQIMKGSSDDGAQKRAPASSTSRHLTPPRPPTATLFPQLTPPTPSSPTPMLSVTTDVDFITAYASTVMLLSPRGGSAHVRLTERTLLWARPLRSSGSTPRVLDSPMGSCTSEKALTLEMALYISLPPPPCTAFFHSDRASVAVPPSSSVSAAGEKDEASFRERSTLPLLVFAARWDFSFSTRCRLSLSSSLSTSMVR